MQEKSLIKRNILQYIELKGITKYKFYQDTGITRGVLDQNNGMSEENTARILAYYNEINPEWLLTGNGAMIRSDLSTGGAVKVYSDNPEAYPLIDMSVAAGFASVKFNIEKRDVKDYYVIPKFRDLKIDFMIEVYGSSMYPKYMSGDIVACTIIRDSKFIQWNKVHIIATTEQGLLLKRIREHDENSILAVSDNPEFPPFKVPFNEISGIALVVGIVRID